MSAWVAEVYAWIAALAWFAFRCHVHQPHGWRLWCIADQVAITGLIAWWLYSLHGLLAR